MNDKFDTPDCFLWKIVDVFCVNNNLVKYFLCYLRQLSTERQVFPHRFTFEVWIRKSVYLSLCLFISLLSVTLPLSVSMYLYLPEQNVLKTDLKSTRVVQFRANSV